MDYDKDFEDRFADTRFGKLHFRRHKGSSPPLIFLHGFGATVLSWKRTVELMSNSMNVYLVDLLGFGASDAPHMEYSVTNQVNALSDFLKGEGLTSFYLIGCSYGGWVAARYASFNNIMGLVLEDSAGLKEDMDELAKSRPERIDELRKRAMLMENKDYVVDSTLQRREDEELDDEVLAGIRSPTLIIWGSDDQTIDPKFAKLFQEGIKGSRLEIIENGGHTSHFKNPKAFLFVLLRFIDQAPR